MTGKPPFLPCADGIEVFSAANNALIQDCARCIVCEKSGAWATALRWQSARPLPIVESRNLADAQSELNKSPGAVLAIEVTVANAEGVFHWLTESLRRSRDVCPIVFLSRELSGLADLFQEAGAWVVASPRRLDRAARYVERHLATITPPELPLREAIWARLPWKSRGA